jgi:hypothetical protein
MRGLTLVVAGVGLAALLLTQFGAIEAGVAGRDFGRCVVSCQGVKQSCNRQCNADCKAITPPDSQEREDCIFDCRVGCDDNGLECEVMCKAIRDAPTPEEP